MTGRVATIILGVSVATVFLGWVMWRAARSVERAESDPKYQRRWLIVFGMVYVLGAIVGISNVASGHAPPLSLLGLPIPVLIAWYFVRAAIRVKVPPK
jgi:heme A synthase